MESLVNVASPYTGLMSRFSSSFQSFIKQLGEARSKAEEDRILAQEVVKLKIEIRKPDLTVRQQKEQIIRLIYCDMLGHDVKFSYFEAIKFAQQPKQIYLAEKRIGYTALSVFLTDKNEEECMMNMSSVQRDLNSTNIVEICYGLTAASRLVFSDMLPGIRPIVTKLMKHEHEMVRKRAVMTMFRFYQLDPVGSADMKEEFSKLLYSDGSPAVMGVTLNVFHSLIKDEGSPPFCSLTATFVNLLKQILDHKLPKDLDYKKLPSPWMQIKLLQILAMLGNGNINESKKMYEMLKMCLHAANMEVPIGCAVAYECMKTISVIHPHEVLIQQAATKAGILLISNHYNLKYLGINIIKEFVRVDVSFATNHQMEIINCLNDQDESLKWKTLDLLYQMTSLSNVKLICSKLINYLRSTLDEYVRTALVSRITNLAEKFAPDNEWYIDTMNEVFELGGDLVPNDVAYNMMMLIGEGIDDEAETNADSATDDLRRNAVISYMELLRKPNLPEILIKLVVWVLGEYISLIEYYDVGDILQNMYRMLEMEYKDTETQCWIVGAIMKILSQQKNWKQYLQPTPYLSFNAAQIYKEMITALGIHNENLDDVFPYDASCDEVEFNDMFIAMDEYVNRALTNGAKPYSNDVDKRNTDIIVEPTSPKVKSLIFTAHVQQNSISESTPKAMSPVKEIVQIKKKKLWGPEGRIQPKANSSSSYSTDDNTLSSQNDGLSSQSGSSTRSDSFKAEEKKEIQLEQVNKVTPPPPRSFSKQELEAMALFNTTTSEGADTNVTKQVGLRGKRSGGKSTKSKQLKKDLIEISSDTSSNISSNNSNNTLSNNSSLLCDVSDSETLGSNFHNQQNKNTLIEGENILKFTTMEGRLLESMTPVASGSDNLFDGMEFESKIPTKTTEVYKSLEKLNSSKEESLSTIPTNQHPPFQDNIDVRNNKETTEDLLFADLEINTKDTIESQRVQENITQVTTTESQSINLLDDNNTSHPNNVSTKLEIIQEFKSKMTLPDDLISYPNSTNKIELCNDINFRLMCQFVFKPDSTVLILFCYNQSVQTLNSIKLSIKLPSNLKSSNEECSTFLKPSLETMTSFCHVIDILYQSPALHMELSGHVLYRDFRNVEKRLFIRHPITFNVMLRPLVITNNLYEEKWKVKSLYEKREKLERKIKVSEFVETIQERCFIYPVQIIGREIISATSVLNRHEILIYFSVTKLMIDIRIKSTSKLLNETIFKMLANVLL